MLTSWRSQCQTSLWTEKLFRDLENVQNISERFSVWKWVRNNNNLWTKEWSTNRRLKVVKYIEIWKQCRLTLKASCEEK